MAWPPLDPGIEVLPGTDVDDLWDRFEVFEALHHPLTICNPMTSAELDEAIEALAIDSGANVVDLACGYGELLLRAAERRSIHGVGVDLSPWMLNEAKRRAAERVPGADLGWVLGEAHDHRLNRRAERVVCLGAEWIWHGFNGTVRATAERCAPGGRVMIGAARLHLEADRDEVRRHWGVVETVDDMATALETHGLRPLHRIDPDDAGWDHYLAATARAARQWATEHPGPRADEWLAEQADWQRARERDRAIIGWSVWIAELR